MPVQVYPRGCFLYRTNFRVLATVRAFVDSFSVVHLAIVKLEDRNEYYVTYIREYASLHDGILFYPRGRSKLHGPYSIKRAIQEFLSKARRYARITREDLEKLRALLS